MSSENDIIMREAERVFGDPAKAARWMSRPKTWLNGSSPAAVLDNPEGRALVREMLVRIEEGLPVSDPISRPHPKQRGGTLDTAVPDDAQLRRSASAPGTHQPLLYVRDPRVCWQHAPV
ncbi:MAG: DUF2384 domain-containing protein [Thiogranum sp.]|nr:DUF2384 domain-containing protein [Thiogranum sp.]